MLGKRNKIMIILIFAIIFFLLACAFLIQNGFHNLTSSVGTSYKKSLVEKTEETYQQYYQTSYNYAESKHHVSNDAMITVEDIRETAQLEVLHVSATEVIIKDDNTPKIWVSMTGTGNYVVDLSAGEYIVDNNRQYVLVRVPTPVLNTPINIHDDKTKTYKYENNEVLLFGGNPSDGLDNANEIRKEGQEKVQIALESNQTYYEAAQKAAKSSISNLVKSFNPTLPNLTVDVEFVD